MEQIKITSTSYSGFIESRQGGRSENQDYLDYWETPLGFLVVVCDGMGGGPAGRVASSFATDVIGKYVSSVEYGKIGKKEALTNAIQEANATLLEMQSKNASLQGMGTTVTALLFDAFSVVAAHVGDSRIYQFRFGRKIFRTFDHSVVMERARDGLITEEEARTAPDSNVVTRALGIKPEVNVSIQELSYERGDRFVLCTDGVWGSMPEKRLIKLLTQTPNLSGTVEKTMITVEEIGHAQGDTHDNFTIALVETNINSQKKEPMTHFTRNLIRILAIISVVSILINVFFWFFKKEPEQTITNIPDQTEIQRLQDKNDELNQTIQDLKEQIQSNQTKIESSDLDIENRNKEIQSKNQRINDLEKNIERQNKKIAELEKELEMVNSSTQADIIIGKMEDLAKKLVKLQNATLSVEKAYEDGLAEDIISLMENITKDLRKINPKSQLSDKIDTVKENIRNNKNNKDVPKDLKKLIADLVVELRKPGNINYVKAKAN